MNETRRVTWLLTLSVLLAACGLGSPQDEVGQSSSGVQSGAGQPDPESYQRPDEQREVDGPSEQRPQSRGGGDEAVERLG